MIIIDAKGGIVSTCDANSAEQKQPKMIQISRQPETGLPTDLSDELYGVERERARNAAIEAFSGFSSQDLVGQDLNEQVATTVDAPVYADPVLQSQSDVSQIQQLALTARSHRGSTRTFVKKNAPNIGLAALFFVGMLYGALVVGHYDESSINALSFITHGFISNRAVQPLYQTFLNAITSTGIMVLGLYLLGFSAIAVPFSAGVLIFRGLGLGLSMGYLYLYHAGSGVLFSLVMIIPGALLSFFALLFSCRTSIEMSMYFFRKLFPKKEDKWSSNRLFWRYSKKFAGYGMMIVAAAGMDCIMTFFFAQFF